MALFKVGGGQFPLAESAKACPVGLIGGGGGGGGEGHTCQGQAQPPYFYKENQNESVTSFSYTTNKQG